MLRISLSEPPVCTHRVSYTARLRASLLSRTTGSAYTISKIKKEGKL